MPTNGKNLGELLSDLMENEGITVEKLSSLTNIPIRFIVSMRENELDKLPAEPYIRGYLKKIADVLKTDEQSLINAYKESKGVAKSGDADRLPANQYARVPIKKGWFVAPILVLLLFITLFVRSNEILGVPELHIDLPSVVYTESIEITGSVRKGDTLTLNGEIVYTDDLGNFKEPVLLKPGLNTLQFKVKRFLGKESIVVKEVY